MCIDKSKGDIGIKSLSKMNQALLCKWSWRFANDRNSLWRKVICYKYGESFGGCIPVISEAAMRLVYGRRSGKSDPVFPELAICPRGWKE